jgi:hypothetical protein
MPTENGYSNQKKLGTAQFKTVNDLGSGRHGTAVSSKALYDISAAQTIASVTPVVNSNGQIYAYDIELTAHGVTQDSGVLKFTSGALTGWEVQIESVQDVDTLRILAITPSAPTTAMDAKPMGWVTSKADSDGNLNFSPGPLQFIRDGLAEEIEEDTANSADNRGLPSLAMFYKDGNQVSVNIDSVTPANNRPLPVEIAGTSGTVTINAGDLSVSIVSTNDSVAVGDAATGLTANVTTNATSSLEELHIRDDDANTTLTAIAADIALIEAKDFATQTTLATLATEATLAAAAADIALIEAKDFATETTLAAIKTAAELLDDAVNTDANPAGTKGLLVGGIDGSGDFQRVSVNTAGELSVTFGSAGFATETTLSALNNKHNADFGASSGGIRTAAQIGNATGAADFNAGADSAQTLRVSANLKRAGNDLSYNAGTSDANTLRVIPASDYVPPQPTAMTPSFQEDLTVSNSAETFTAPANAKCCVVQAPSSNTVNLRIKIGGATATVSSGYVLEPGRSESFPFAGSISYIAESGSGQAINVHFGV